MIFAIITTHIIGECDSLIIGARSIRGRLQRKVSFCTTEREDDNSMSKRKLILGIKRNRFNSLDSMRHIDCMIEAADILLKDPGKRIKDLSLDKPRLIPERKRVSRKELRTIKRKLFKDAVKKYLAINKAINDMSKGEEDRMQSLKNVNTLLSQAIKDLSWDLS